MRRAPIICTITLLAGILLAGNAGVQELVEAERAFARAAAADGMRAAFLSVMSEDAILFRPRPVNGKKWFLDRPAPPGLLSWNPTHAELSLAGDLGYTTGPWRYQSGEQDRPPVFGHYVSIWSREKEREWRLVLDIGIGHAEPPESAREPAIDERERGGAPQMPTVDRQALTRSLLQLDRDFSEKVLSDGEISAYETMANRDVRLYREGSMPVVGRAAVRKLLDGSERALAARPAAADIASSGDLGYTYGVASPPQGSEGDSVSYLRIWRSDHGGRWTIALDVALPIPAESTDPGS